MAKSIAKPTKPKTAAKTSKDAKKAVPKKSILKKTDPAKKTPMKKTAPAKKVKDAKKTILKKPKEKKATANKAKKKEENIALEPENQEDFDEVLSTLSNEDCKPGTLYIGHIPHGFYEQQIREYFTQFGTVLKVRLARSKKSGGYKGFGFVQFASDEVAEIAAEAMDGYLMFDKLLQCKVMSAQAQHRNLWKGANKKFVYQNRAARDNKLQQRERTEEQKKKVLKRVLEKDSKRQRKLKSLGIDYDFPSIKSQLDSDKPAAAADEPSIDESKDTDVSSSVVEDTKQKIVKKKRKRTDE